MHGKLAASGFFQQFINGNKGGESPTHSPLPTAYFFIKGLCTAYGVRPYFEIAFCVLFQSKTNNVLVVSISMTKIKNIVCGMHMHRPIVRLQQFMLYSL